MDALLPTNKTLAFGSATVNYSVYVDGSDCPGGNSLVMDIKTTVPLGGGASNNPDQRLTDLKTACQATVQASGEIENEASQNAQQQLIVTAQQEYQQQPQQGQQLFQALPTPPLSPPSTSSTNYGGGPAYDNRLQTIEYALCKMAPEFGTCPETAANVPQGGPNIAGRKRWNIPQGQPQSDPGYRPTWAGGRTQEVIRPTWTDNTGPSADVGMRGAPSWATRQETPSTTSAIQRRAATGPKTTRSGICPRPTQVLRATKPLPVPAYTAKLRWRHPGTTSGIFSQPQSQIPAGGPTRICQPVPLSRSAQPTRTPPATRRFGQPTARTTRAGAMLPSESSASASSTGPGATEILHLVSKFNDLEETAHVEVKNTGAQKEALNESAAALKNENNPQS